MDPNSIAASYRLRTVRIGVWATLLTVGGLIVYPFFGRVEGLDTEAYHLVLVVALLGVGAIALLPWKKLVGKGWDLGFMYAWSALDILLVTGVIVTSGPEHRGMFTIYALTTIFFGAAGYSARAQVALLAMTYAAYLGAITVMGWEIPLGLIFVRLILLAAIAYLSSYLAIELSRQMSNLTEARRESERRANLLAAVAKASRDISTLETGAVLEAVVDSALALGFDAANFCFFEDEGKYFRVRHGKGIPDLFNDQRVPVEMGMPGKVLSARATVIADPYDAMDEAIPELVDAGFRVVVATPVWADRRIEAVLVAGSKEPREIAPPDIEAFELLAKQAERAMENAKMFEDEKRTAQRLAELDRLKSDFLANVSHELRTPLTVIEGMGATLQQHWERLDEAKKLKLISRVNANATSLSTIISTLLDFSQIEQGKLSRQDSAFDLGEIASTALGRISDLFVDHTIDSDIEQGLIVVGDAGLLERVIENLLSNAVKHTPAGTRVEVKTFREGERVVVSVSDNGPGIPEADLSHISERFFRGGETDTRPTRGVGLGLALATEVLAMHGAELKVASGPEGGAAFSFELPIAARSLPEAEEASGM